MYRNDAIGKLVSYTFWVLSLSAFFISCGYTTPVFAGTFPGNQLYVSPTGNDGVTRAANNINNPWKTISKAMLTAEAGDVVNFRAGTYSVTSDIVTSNANNGTANNRIVFTNYQDESVLFTGGKIRIDREYWTISGINGQTDDILFWVGKDDDGDYCIIENGTFTLTAFGGGSNIGPIQFQTDGSYHGIVRNNRFIGPGSGGNQNTAGIFIWRSQGIKILNNEFSGFPSPLFYKHTGVAFNTGIEIAYNYFHDNGYGLGVAMQYADIHDNLLVNSQIFIGQGGGDGDDGSNQGGDYNNIHHNTIVNDKIDLVDTNSGDGWGATNNTVKDNVMTKTMHIAPYANTPHNTILDYNLYPGSENAVLNNHTYYTLSGWKSFSGQDANSIAGTAIFVGGGSIAGYALAAGSPGKGSASDGRDMGADMTKVGIAGTPVEVIAPPNPPDML